MNLICSFNTFQKRLFFKDFSEGTISCLSSVVVLATFLWPDYLYPRLDMDTFLRAPSKIHEMVSLFIFNVWL